MELLNFYWRGIVYFASSLTFFFVSLTYWFNPFFSGLLFSKFRFGWKMGIHVVSQKPSNKPSFLTFLVVAEKESSTVLHQITTSFAHSSLDLNGNQVEKLKSIGCCLF